MSTKIVIDIEGMICGSDSITDEEADDVMDAVMNAIEDKGLMFCGGYNLVDFHDDTDD